MAVPKKDDLSLALGSYRLDNHSNFINDRAMMVALRLAHLFHNIVDSNLATTRASIRVALKISRGAQDM